MYSIPVNARADHSDATLVWYAIYTRHQHEKTVARILTSKGFETLLPLCETARKWKDRTKLVSMPLFPCYVFLHGGTERHLEIITTPGIHAVVSNAGRPIAIPASEINAIRQTIESGSPVEPHPFLKCGEQVRVKRGPLEGIEGILVRKKGLCRLVLSVVMLGKAIAVEVDGLQVERLKRESGYGTSRAPVFPHPEPKIVECVI